MKFKKIKRIKKKQNKKYKTLRIIKRNFQEYLKKFGMKVLEGSSVTEQPTEKKKKNVWTSCKQTGFSL